MSHPLCERNPTIATARNESARREFVAELHKALTSLQYGQIQVFVQDGEVTRVEKTEKVRLYRSTAVSE